MSAAQTPAKVDFEREIQPLFREHCVECHGPSQQMRGLRLDRRRDALPNRVGQTAHALSRGTVHGASCSSGSPARKARRKCLRRDRSRRSNQVDSGVDRSGRGMAGRTVRGSGFHSGGRHRGEDANGVAGGKGERIPTSGEGKSKVNQCQGAGWMDSADAGGALR
jgi:hypothetical protein